MNALRALVTLIATTALVLSIVAINQDVDMSSFVTKIEVEDSQAHFAEELEDRFRELFSERFAYSLADIEGRLESFQNDSLGAATVPAVIANFETSLASSITSAATEMTLVSFTDRDGNSLTTGTYYGFTVDEGTASEEHVIGMATSSNTITNLTRGVSVTTGSTSISALKKAHRRGASVKITNAPALVLISRILRAEEEVGYTPTSGGHLTTKDYVDDLALGTTTVPASLTDDGIVELATGQEAASSTATGGSGSALSLHTGISTTTSGTAHTVPVTGLSGYLAGTFLSQVADFQEFTGSATWTKPTAFNYNTVYVQCWGGGGAGAAGLTHSGGGGGGGYVDGWFDADDLASEVYVTVGVGGIGGAGDGMVGSSTTFGSHLTAYAGGGGGSDNGTGYGGGGGCFFSVGETTAGPGVAEAGSPGYPLCGIGNTASTSAPHSGAGAHKTAAASVDGGSSVYGGGGGGNGYTGSVGGTSIFGGNGGGYGANGSQPGGGGGGHATAAGSGGDGMCTVITI